MVHKKQASMSKQELTPTGYSGFQNVLGFQILDSGIFGGRKIWQAFSL